jgi:hypothetical protein
MSEYNSTGVTGEPKYYGMWDKDTIVLAQHQVQHMKFN